MVRRGIWLIGILIALAAVTELVGLAMLSYGDHTYPSYWRGRANEPGDFLYVALGDSAAQGLGASRPSHSYVGLIARDIEQRTGRTVRVVNLSKTGATIQDALREQVPQLPNYSPDLVTVEIGANDMKRYDDAAFRHDFESLVQALPPGKSVVSNMPYFGGRRNQNRAARLANQTINQLAISYKLPQAQLFNALQSRQSPWIYASDFFHPNDRGYRIWFEAFEPGVRQIIDSE